MIAAPYPIPPQPGPLRAPSEEQVAAAYPELRDHALTLAWAGEALGRQTSQLLRLACAGELLVVPGPWPMRQADYPGYFVPAWQLRPGGGPHPALPAVLAAAAEAGWTSLQLHRFMTRPLDPDGSTPATLLRAGDTALVTELIRGEPAVRPVQQPSTTRQRVRRRTGLHRPHRAEARRIHDRRSASRTRGQR